MDRSRKPQKNIGFQPWNSENRAVSGPFVLSGIPDSTDRERIRDFFHSDPNTAPQKGIWTGVASVLGFTGTTWDEPPVPEGNTPEPLTGLELPETATDVDKEKGGDHMNQNSKEKKLHMKRLQIRRRLAAATLALAMLCPMLPFRSLGAEALIVTKKMTNVDATTGLPDGTGELPTISIETNAVIDGANHLTGFVEVAIRAKPAILHLDGSGIPVPSISATGYDHSEIQPFAHMAVALEYSDKLTPVEWDKSDGNWEKLDATTPEEVNLTDALGVGFSAYDMVEMDVLHKKTRTAHATVSAKLDADGNKDGTDFNDGGYLYLMAGGFDGKDFQKTDPVTGLPMTDAAGVPIVEDTVLAVVRFKYTVDPDDNENPWSTMFPKGKGNANVTDWIDPRSGKCLVKLTDAVTLRKAEDHIAQWEVTYDSGDSDARPFGNGFYHSTDQTTGREAYDLSLPSSDPNYMSTYTNCMDVSLVDTTPGAVKDTTAVVPGTINYTLVNRLSYDYGRGDASDYATILFYDWDDTLIGSMVVDKDLDSRGKVNEFVRDNFIYTDGKNAPAGDDDNLSLQDNTAATVSSLEREDNYRGKYPSTPQNLDTDGSVIDDGTVCDGVTNSNPDSAAFPLTNKLDYVFFKRPMENDESKKPDPTDTTKYPGGASDPQYEEDLETWRATCYIQETDSSGHPLWDTEFPYIHGWAVVPDYAHPEEVWTTLGTTGELISYTDYMAVTGGNMINAGAPAALNVTDQEFYFANFDFSAYNIDTDTTCIAVKAIYEPGVDLLQDFSYRLMENPYYNKLNFKPSGTGGAYSVELVYDRSSTLMGPLQGVSRVRDIVVRQDVTLDVKGKEGDATVTKADGTSISDAVVTLYNADNSAESAKSETAFIKVDVSNTDTLTFTLALSALQNKVDYFIQENYNNNFVSAGGRTDSNSTYRPSAAGDDKRFTEDNYHYKTVDSNLLDGVYDATSYDMRLGTHGFVLFGTLNNILEQAAIYNREKAKGASAAAAAKSTYDTYTTPQNLLDANLRKNSPDDPTAADAEDIRLAIAEAVDQVETLHKGDPDYWDTKHDHASLTYHQLQLFINQYVSTGSATLQSPSAAETAVISWCHYHDLCVDSSAGKPNTWAKLITAADTGDVANLNLLTANDIENYFHLRKDGAGSVYTTADLPTFVSEIQTAVAAIKGQGVATAAITWDQVQYYLDQKVLGATAAAMDSYGAQNYWWYDGATTSAIGSWTDLDRAVKEAASGLSTSTLPDGNPVNRRPAKLNQLEPAFNNNAAAANADPDWIAATHNLGADDANTHAGQSIATKFANFTDFTSVVIDAWEQANALATPVTTPSWEQVQYHVIHRTDPSYAFPPNDAGTKPESDSYFWKDGGEKIVDLPGMLRVAKAGGTAWSNFDFTAFDALGFDFALKFDGTPITAADFPAVKTSIEKYAATATLTVSNLWEWTQANIIHDGAAVLNDVNWETRYYWWKGGGAFPSPNFTGVITGADKATDADGLAKMLSEAAFRVKFNGGDWGTGLDETVLNDGRLAADVLVASPTDFSKASEFTHFTAADVAGFKTTMEAITTAKHPMIGPVPTLPRQDSSWEEIQYYLLEGSLPGPGDLAAKDYWWKSMDSKASPPSVDFATLTSMIQDVADDPTNPSKLAALKAWFTVDKANNMMFSFDGYGMPFTVASGHDVLLASIPWETFDYYGTLGCGSPGALTVTWYQIQSIFFCNTFMGAPSMLDAGTAVMYLGGYGMPDMSMDPSWTSMASFSMRVPVKRKAPVTTTSSAVPQTSEDGLTETTTVTEKVYNEETGLEDSVTTVTAVTRTQIDGATVVTTTVTKTTVSIDPATGEVTVTTTSDTSTTIETEEETVGPDVPVGPSSTYHTSDDTSSIGPTAPVGPTTPVVPSSDDDGDDDVGTTPVGPDAPVVPPSDNDGDDDVGTTPVGPDVPGGPSLDTSTTYHTDNDTDLISTATHFEAGIMRLAQLLSTPAVTPERVPRGALAQPQSVPKLMDLRDPLTPRAVPSPGREAEKLLTLRRAGGRDGPPLLYALFKTEQDQIFHFITGRWAKGRTQR